MRLPRRAVLLFALPLLCAGLGTVSVHAAGGPAAAGPPASVRAASPSQAIEHRTRLELLRRVGLQPATAQPDPSAGVERVTVRLAVGEPAAAVRIGARRSGRGAAVLPRSAELGPDDMVVVAVDADGKGLTALVVPDPRVQRAESAGVDGLLTGGTVRLRDAEGVVDLPADPRRSALHVYGQQPDGSLTLVGTAPAPPPSSSTTTPARPPAPSAQLRVAGPAENRLDVVVLGDGYTAAEADKFAADAEAFASTFLGEQPFAEYSPYINIRRLDVVSAQSGADHPERTPAVYVDTAFNATYNCGGAVRRICVDGSRVTAVLGDSLSPAERDIVLVLVNDPQYGGSGGSVAVASTHTYSAEVALHEIGHSFGQLADEYGGNSGGTCGSSEPTAVNATRTIDRATLKWKAWVSAETPLPTSTTTDGVAGAYLGAAVCDTGLYRPTYNSKMRSLNRPFEQVNVEQLVRRIYAFVRPLDAVSPSSSTVVAQAGATQTFTASVVGPAFHALSVRWMVDGVERATGSRLDLSYDSLGPGSHVVAVEVRDPTLLVRHDPAGALRQSHSWTVQGPVGPGTYQESHPAVVYTGSWAASQHKKDSGGAVRVAGTGPATASLIFTGSSVRWVARKGSTGGNTRVYVDGVEVLPVVDLYSSGTSYQQTVFTRTGLPAGTHTLRLEHSGTKRAAATDDSVVLDAFVVSP